MQTDNLYLSEGDFVRSGSFRDMRRHFTSQEFHFAHAYFSLIELAHERIHRVRANDIRVDIPSVEGLGSPLFVEMFTVREK